MSEKEEEEEEEEETSTTVKVDPRAIAPAGFFDDDDDQQLHFSTSSSIATDEGSRGSSLSAKPAVVAFADDPDFAFITSKEMATAEQRDQLRAFLQTTDPLLAKAINSDKLLVMHRVEDVAGALHRKYQGRLPQGWTSASSASSSSATPHTSQDATTISDRKINEILDTEEHFLLTITELKNKYLDLVYEALGNDKHKPALGLTLEETNQIFEQLPQICRFSQQLLYKLEYVNLVRSQPVSKEGRAIHVGQAFREVASKLHVYAPVILSYQHSLEILTQATNRLASAASSSKKSKKPSKYKTFLQLWEDATANNAVLRGQQLNAVLITPMQRIPRYKMLLEQLVKDCDSPDSVQVVQEALDLFGSAAKNINEAMRSHEKLVGFFGADADLKPLSSTGGTTKDGEVKIINTYTNRKAGHQ